MKTLGIDIGGSALKGAIVDTTTGKLLSERFRIDTTDTLTPKEMAGAVKAMTRHFNWRGPVGIGFPGVIQGSTIWTSANLDKKFIGCDGAMLFGQATRCPIAMINDAAAAGAAEMRYGAGCDFMGKALLLTLGTGVDAVMSANMPGASAEPTHRTMWLCCSTECSTECKFASRRKAAA
jgi:polyphosphate glucokinase